MQRNGAKNRRSRRCDAAKERLMQNCNEACKRGNRCNTINPQSSTFLYSIQDYGPDRHSNGATNSYHGIIEVGVPAHDDDVVTAFHESGAKRSGMIIHK